MKETVSVIGYGRFGALLCEILSPHCDVKVCDPNAKNCSFPVVETEEALTSNVVFYCVPISQFESVISEHSKYLNKQPSKTIFDVLSVKVHPKNVLSKYLDKKHEIILTHPLFGPDSVKICGVKGLPLVLDPIRCNQTNYQKWKDIFSQIGLQIIEMSADEHDRLAANSQGIAHFIGRILGELLIEPSSIDTIGAKKLHEIKDQVCNDTWQLFNDLQNYNPYTLEMRIKLGAAQEKIYNKLLPNRINKETLVVGIQGGKGSFNEQAARYYLRRNEIENFKLVYLYTTDKVLKALHGGEVDRGQFAIHNSKGGIVTESIDAMSHFNFHILEEFEILISHTLMIRKDAELKDIDTVMTHPQALKQCTKALSERYSHLKQVSGEGELVDHAKVAEQLGMGNLSLNICTIGSKILAELYDLQIIEENIQDLKENYTSFLWVQRLP